MGGDRQGQRAKREGTTPGSRGNVMLGFSDVVNQEHQRVRAFKEEPGRKWEKLYDQLLALRRRTGMPAPCIPRPQRR